MVRIITLTLAILVIILGMAVMFLRLGPVQADDHNNLRLQHIHVMNIWKCAEDSSLLVGRGDYDGDTNLWDYYVCRQRANLDG